MRAIRSRTGSRMAVAAAIVLMGLMADPSFAKKGDADADAQIQAMTVELKKIEVADKRHAATAEIGKAEALRDKARSMVGDRKQREELARVLEELEATLALAQAKMIEAEKLAELEAEQQKLDATRKELAQTRGQVEQLEKEQAKIERQLGGGK